jgi:hypothetical protein
MLKILPTHYFAQKLADYAHVKPENVALGNGSIELLDLLSDFDGQSGRDEAVLVQLIIPHTCRLKYFGWKINFANYPPG